MTDKSASIATVTHIRRLSWKNKLSESKPIIVFLLMLILSSAILCGAIIPFICKLSLVGSWCYFPLFFLGGTAASLGVVFGVRFVDRRLFGTMKAGILAVEDRVISGNSKTQMADLEKLVAGYLKLKRMEAADYYSKKLLDLSKSGGTEVLKLSDWMVTTECWVSTDNYHSRWNYKLVWLFETRGILTLCPSKVDFQSKKLSFSCSPSKIVSVELKRHPIWLKPIPLRYISLIIDESGVRHTFNLTPSFSQTDTIFDCNHLVNVWYQRLQKLRQEINPVSNIPDWLKDIAT